jgi:hypothetical protein
MLRLGDSGVFSGKHKRNMDQSNLNETEDDFPPERGPLSQVFKVTRMFLGPFPFSFSLLYN